MKILMPLFMISLIVPPLLVTLGWAVSSKSMKDREKTSPFECGFDPARTARIPFSSRFFLLAVIFLVFDIEIVLLIPLPVILKTHSPMILSMTTTIFLSILILGLLHEWLQGSLEWAS